MDTKKIVKNLQLSTGAGVRIAVLDSGLNPQFPRLRGRPWKVFDCDLQDDGLRVRPMPEGSSSDRNGHGSVVQSCIADAAPEAQIDHFRVLDENNHCDSNLLCLALDHVVEKNYDIVNLSLGTRNEDHIPWLVTIMKRAYERDITVVAASSNVGNTLYPARFTYCVSCEAMSGGNPFVLRFKPASVVEFSGWGVNVPVPAPNGRTLSVSGSSYAAAHISGLCARIIELQGKRAPLDTKILLREIAFSQAG